MMVDIKNPYNFSDFLKNVSPWTPLDAPHLKGAKQPKLIYRKNEIICDLTGKKSSDLALEKIFSTMIDQLDSYPLQILSRSQAPRLETLASIVQQQTKAYKDKHWPITLFFKSLIYGDIDELSNALVDKISALQTLPSSEMQKKTWGMGNLSTEEITKLQDQMKNDNEKKKAQAPLVRKEFQTTEKNFRETMESAVKNLKVLIKLKENPDIKSIHPLFRAEGDPSLEKCLEAYELMVHETKKMEQSLMEVDNVSGPPDNFEANCNRSIARIYISEEFDNYVEAAMKASSYYEELRALAVDLGKHNVFEGNQLADLDLPPDPPGFERTPDLKLDAVVTYRFAPVMQRVMRHEILMKALIDTIPINSDEFETVLESALTAETQVAKMDFEQKYDEVHNKLYHLE